MSNIRRLAGVLVLSIFTTLSVSAFEHHAVTNPPEHIRAGESYSNIYNLVWHAILKEAEIDAEIVFAPHVRKRRMFAQGELVLDCCSAPEWRKRPEEEKVQHYTLPIIKVRERYVFKKGQVREISREDFSKLKFSVVRGFSYKDDEMFGVQIEGNTKEDVLDLVEAGRADVTVMDEREFVLFMQRSPRELEMGGSHSVVEIGARVHELRVDLLPKLNRAISHLHKNGTIDKIVKAAQAQEAAFKSTPQASH